MIPSVKKRNTLFFFFLECDFYMGKAEYEWWSENFFLKIYLVYIDIGILFLFIFWLLSSYYIRHLSEEVELDIYHAL